MAVVWPVIRSTRVSALIWALVRSSPVALADSAAARSDAKHATACSTGRTAVIVAMVSGRGRMDTYRSSRARAARRTAASWSSSITRRRTAWLISGTDIDSTTGPSSAIDPATVLPGQTPRLRDRRPHTPLRHPPRRQSAQRGGHLGRPTPGRRPAGATPTPANTWSRGRSDPRSPARAAAPARPATPAARAARSRSRPSAAPAPPPSAALRPLQEPDPIDPLPVSRQHRTTAIAARSGQPTTRAARDSVRFLASPTCVRY